MAKVPFSKRQDPEAGEMVQIKANSVEVARFLRERQHE